MKCIIIAAALSLGAAEVHADPTCEKLMEQFDRTSRWESIYEAKYESSPMAAAELHLKVIEGMLARQMNLQMMIALKCPLPKPVVPGGYLVDGAKCALAETKAMARNAKPGTPIPECDLLKWDGSEGVANSTK